MSGKRWSGLVRVSMETYGNGRTAFVVERHEKALAGGNWCPVGRNDTIEEAMASAESLYASLLVKSEVIET